MPLVSVVIPFHGRIAWLEQAVDSVMSQTFGNFELILVDDGSPEDPSAIRTLKDERVKLLRQENKGRSAARNAGVWAAKGNYIAFLDSDDLFLPQKLEKQVALMESNPNALLSHTSYLRIDSSGRVLEEAESGGFSGNVYPRILTSCPIATPTVMVRAEAFKTFSFEEGVHIGEDIILWSRISRVSQVLGIIEPLSLVRIHGDNATCSLHSQLVSVRNITRCATLYDKHLPLFFRLREVSRVHAIVAWRYFEEERRWEGLKCLARGVSVWPFLIFTPSGIVALMGAVTPCRHRSGVLRFLRTSRAVFSHCLALLRLCSFAVRLLLTDPAEFKRRARKAG